MVPALKPYIPSEKPTHLRLCERVRSCCPDPGVSILVLLVPVLGSLLIVSLLLPLGPFPMSSHSFSPYWDLPPAIPLQCEVGLYFWRFAILAYWWGMVMSLASYITKVTKPEFILGKWLLHWSFSRESGQLSPPSLHLVSHTCPGNLGPDTIVEQTTPGTDSCTLLWGNIRTLGGIGDTVERALWQRHMKPCASLGGYLPRSYTAQRGGVSWCLLARIDSGIGSPGSILSLVLRLPCAGKLTSPQTGFHSSLVKCQVGKYSFTCLWGSAWMS